MAAPSGSGSTNQTKDREGLQQWAEGKREELDELYIATRLEVERQVRQLREETLKREEEMRRDLWSRTNRQVDQMRDQYEREYIEKKMALESLIKLKFQELEMEGQQKEVPQRKESDPTRRKHRHRTKKSHNRSRDASIHKLDRSTPGKMNKSPGRSSCVKLKTTTKSSAKLESKTCGGEAFSIRSDHSQIAPKTLISSASDLFDPSTVKSNSHTKPSSQNANRSTAEITPKAKSGTSCEHKISNKPKSQSNERTNTSKEEIFKSESGYKSSSGIGRGQQQQVKPSPSLKETNLTSASKIKSRPNVELWKRWDRWS